MSAFFFRILPLAVAMAFAGPAWSYDASLAQGYAKLFAPVEGASVGKALHLIPAGTFVDAINAREPLVVLDVRTPAENGFYGVTLPDALAIPLNELFTEANLARIPTERPVIVVCMAGSRALVAGTALRHIGFDNVYILKGGLKGLAAYLGPGEANPTAVK